MFLSRETVDTVVKKLNIDPLKKYTSDELLNKYGKGLYLIHYSLHKNYPIIFHLLECKGTLIRYCIEVYTTILQTPENIRSWWNYVEEDFIYTFPRREFLDLDADEKGYAINFTYHNEKVFNATILEILSSVEMSLWEALYNTEEAKDDPQMVIKNMKHFAYCLQEGIEIAEIRQKEYDGMIQNGISPDLAMEETSVSAYNLTQERIHNV